MAAPDARAQAVVDALRRDELAACILDSVDAGPFVRVFLSFVVVCACVLMVRVLVLNLDFGLFDVDLDLEWDSDSDLDLDLDLDGGGRVQGRTGREQRAIDTSKDNFFASIVAEQPKVYSHRSRRQSRATRENVIEAVIATGAY